jgi:glucose-6-phosphate isomerase
VIWGIDSFDQWGVELGKALAQRISREVAGDGPAAEGHDSSTAALMRRYIHSRDRSAK